jgi:hypothetical protein
MLDNGDELLYRQVHPAFIDDGLPTSPAFKVFPKDEGYLSTSRSAMTSAAGSFELHIGAKGLQSAGVWAVSVHECQLENRAAFHDPEPGPPQDPVHSLVDHVGLNEKQLGAIARRFKAKAIARGICHPVPNSMAGTLNEGATGT